jgi:hypothetical protein
MSFGGDGSGLDNESATMDQSAGKLCPTSGLPGGPAPKSSALTALVSAHPRTGRVINARTIRVDMVRGECKTHAKTGDNSFQEPASTEDGGQGPNLGAGAPDRGGAVPGFLRRSGA